MVSIMLPQGYYFLAVGFLGVAVGFAVWAAPTAQAQNQGADNCGQFGCFEVLDQLPTGDEETAIGRSIDEFVKRDSPLVTIANILFQVGVALVIAISLVFIVIGGYIYMTAGGDASQISSAKVYIASALAGMVLALIGWLLLNTISPQFTQPTDPIEILQQN